MDRHRCAPRACTDHRKIHGSSETTFRAAPQASRATPPRPTLDATTRPRTLTLPMTSLPTSAISARHSGIHGDGVYAQQAITAGDVIVEYTGELISITEAKRRECARQDRAESDPASSDYLYILDDNWALDGRDSTNIARLINHACEPNCRSDVIDDRVWIIAVHDIRPGDEITFDYCYTFKDGLHHPCRCGSPQCVGFIIAKSQRWRLHRRSARLQPVPSPSKRVLAQPRAG